MKPLRASDHLLFIEDASIRDKARFEGWCDNCGDNWRYRNPSSGTRYADSRDAARTAHRLHLEEVVARMEGNNA